MVAGAMGSLMANAGAMGSTTGVVANIGP